MHFGWRSARRCFPIDRSTASAVFALRQSLEAAIDDERLLAASPCPPAAAVSTVNPDGDTLTLLDTRRSSSTYRRIVGTVALPASSVGPVAGTPTTGTQPHFVTLNKTGTRAFVTNGGDGRIVVVDTTRRRIVNTINTPTPLTGGG